MKGKDFILKGILTSLSAGFLTKNIKAQSLNEVELLKSLGQ